MTTNGDIEFELEAVMPTQFCPTTKTGAMLRLYPSARLWLSAVVWAAREAVGSHRRRAEEAMIWLRSDRMELGSLCWIAEHLHVEVEPWRRRLLKLVEAKCR